MTDPKEKKPPIQTRTPGRLAPRGGMFDRVKLPSPPDRGAERHPIEEILSTAVPASSTGVPQYRSTAVPEQLPELNSTAPTAPPQPPTGVPQYRGTAVPESPIPKARFYRKANEIADQVDRTLTPAESKVFEQLLRLTVGFNRETCQVRISVLMERTGYNSDKTVRTALRGLEIKRRVEKLSSRNSPLGDEYRVLAYSGNNSGTAVPEYRGTAVENTAVLESKFTGELKTNSERQSFDDEAFAGLRSAMAAETGREVEASALAELDELLTSEFKLAAGRADGVSAPGAFFAEHLRRRLWKKEKRQLEEEGKAVGGRQSAAAKVDASKCPDCFGTGMYYPEGFEKGVARCGHARLSDGEG